MRSAPLWRSALRLGARAAAWRDRPGCSGLRVGRRDAGTLPSRLTGLHFRRMRDIARTLARLIFVTHVTLHVVLALLIGH